MSVQLTVYPIKATFRLINKSQRITLFVETNRSLSPLPAKPLPGPRPENAKPIKARFRPLNKSQKTTLSIKTNRCLSGLPALLLLGLRPADTTTRDRKLRDSCCVSLSFKSNTQTTGGGRESESQPKIKRYIALRHINEHSKTIK